MTTRTPQLPKGNWAGYAWIALVSGCSAFFLRRRAEFFHEYNGDIDTFLYQAWRLLSGKLNYIDHFDSKLPIVPYLYVPSFLTGSFWGHRAISDGVLMFSGVLIYFTCQDLCKLVSGEHKTSSLPASRVTAALYIFFGSILPDTAYSGHLFLFANMFLLAGCLLVLRGASNQRVGFMASGGALLGLAIQIRPNILFSILGLIIFSFATRILFLSQTNRPPRLYRSGRQFAVVAAFGILGFLLPFFPYALNSEHASSAYDLSYRLMRDWRREAFGWGGSWEFIRSLFSLYTPRLLGIPYIYVLPLPVLSFNLVLLLRLSRGSKECFASAVGLSMAGYGYISGSIVSFYYSHTFPNYVFHDLWVYSLIAGTSLSIWNSTILGRPKRFAAMTNTLVLALCGLLLTQSLNIRHQEDTRTFYLPPSLLDTLENQSFSSPQNYSLYWRLRQKIPTFGAHSHWNEYANFSISNLPLLKRYGLRNKASSVCGDYLNENRTYLVLFDPNQFICREGMERSWALIKKYPYRKDSRPVELYINSRFLD